MCTWPYLAFLRNARFEMCSRRRMSEEQAVFSGVCESCGRWLDSQFIVSHDRSASMFASSGWCESSGMTDGESGWSAEAQACLCVCVARWLDDSTVAV